MARTDARFAGAATGRCRAAESSISQRPLLSGNIAAQAGHLQIPIFTGVLSGYRESV